jgi:hypothetical protein
MTRQFRTSRRPPVQARRKTAPFRTRAIPPDPSEPELRRFIADYLDQFDPQTEDECAAVDSLIRADRMTRCLWQLETDLLNTRIREFRLIHPDAEPGTLLASHSVRLPAKEAVSTLSIAQKIITFVRAASPSHASNGLGKKCENAKRSEPNPGANTEDKYGGQIRRIRATVTASYNRDIPPIKGLL